MKVDSLPSEPLGKPKCIYCRFKTHTTKISILLSREILQNVAKELNLNYCKLIRSYSQNSDAC